jgi:2'-hydroxyisoflavone reductase
MPSKTILVLGGTGFLGPHVVRALLDDGHEVTLFNRRESGDQLFPELEKLRGNRDGGLDALKGRCWDAVIDTCGYVPRIVRDSAQLLSDSVGLYIFISSISAYADLSKPGTGEEAPLAALEEPSSEEVGKHYGALKALCEAAAEAAMPGRVANIRPGLIAGPGDGSDRFTYWPVRLAQGGRVLAPGDGSTRVQYIDARDLASWLAKIVSKTITGVYNAVGPASPLTMDQLLGACQEASHSDAELVWVDAGFIDEIGVRGWSDLPVWMPAEGGHAGLGSVDNSRALACGLGFRDPVATARDTLLWWNALPADRRAAPRAGLSAEREAQALAAWTAQREVISR